MHWKVKAVVQNAVSRLPPTLSSTTYFWVQRRLGSLRVADPFSRLDAGLETWKRIAEAGRDPVGKVFLEVGTGWMLNVPTAFWLMGAHSTITIDVNRYLKPVLVRESLGQMSERRTEVEALFGSHMDARRFSALMDFHDHEPFTLEGYLDLCKITYVAPGNAAATALDDHTIDFHTSNNVFEHVRPDVLAAILDEGSRIVRDGGLLVHRIDYSDHFSHSDDSISPINFLQYTDRDWDRYADNQFMYMNRLRHDDMLALFSEAKLRVIESHPIVDEQCRELLGSGVIAPAERFRGRPLDTLATVGAWIVSVPEADP